MPSEIYDYIKKQVMRHGLPFAMLCIAVYYFHGQLTDVKEQMNTCNEQLINMYKNDHAEMRDVILNNTQAIEKLTSRK